MVGVSLFGLRLLVNVVLPSLRKQDQLFVLSLPKLDQAFKLEPPYVVGILGVDPDGYPLFAVDEPIDDGDERIEAVYLLEECL